MVVNLYTILSCLLNRSVESVIPDISLITSGYITSGDVGTVLMWWSLSLSDALPDTLESIELDPICCPSLSNITTRSRILSNFLLLAGEIFEVNIITKKFNSYTKVIVDIIHRNGLPVMLQSITLWLQIFPVASNTLIWVLICMLTCSYTWDQMMKALPVHSMKNLFLLFCWSSYLWNSQVALLWNIFHIEVPIWWDP